ncbi:MAG: hypothetical protein JW709_12840 [Sedimentisphaerales bacterium]|nr:hypothetical protein [Sedimentisphaerales bacterium]
MNIGILKKHLQLISYAHRLTIEDNYKWVIVHGFVLPPNFNITLTDVLLRIPSDYPLSPPGIGSARCYLPKHLRFNGRKMRDLHETSGPGWGDWAWFCYEYVNWNPHRDDLIKTLEMIRADLTKPYTCI